MDFLNFKKLFLHLVFIRKKSSVTSFSCRFIIHSPFGRLLRQYGSQTILPILEIYGKHAKESAMRKTEGLMLGIFLAVFAIIGIHSHSFADNSGRRDSFLLQIRSFSMNAGEKIVGTMVTVSQGDIVNASMPRGWRCEFTRMSDRRQMHCFSLHSSYGISASGRIPIFTIIDNSGGGRDSLTFEVLLEMETRDGKTYTKQMSDSELIIR